MLKESVCVFPRPDHDATGRHPMVGCICAGLDGGPQPTIAKAIRTGRIVFAEGNRINALMAARALTGLPEIEAAGNSSSLARERQVRLQDIFSCRK
jgi:hypothetical protein